MEIKPLDTHHEFDIFLGRGWDNWVRVKYSRTGVTVVKSAFQPSADTLELIFYKIKKKFFTQHKTPKGANSGTS